MSVEITPVGGLGEVGRNMTVLSFGEEKVIVDMGLNLEKALSLGRRDIGTMSRDELVRVGGIPDDSDVRSQDVSAIILTHGHLDHIGAVGKLASKYDAKIYATPFTAELVKNVIQSERNLEVDNEIKEMEFGDNIQVGDLEIEFIQGAHSIPQNSFPAIHSSEGVVLCAGGFKIDDAPAVGFSTDYNSLRKLRNSGPVISLICSVRADNPNPTPSESHARKLLEDVMTKASEEGRGLIVTAFSSHIARIKTIAEISIKLDRKPLILGRSLRKKCKIASKLGLVDFPKEVKIHSYPDSIRKLLKIVNESREDYVIITSGHQGEPNSILSRIADKEETYRIKPGDEVIFSASVIPNPMNLANRETLEAKLISQGARIHRDVHVSGHAGKPGTQELIGKIDPAHIVPFHGTFEKMKSVTKIGKKIGYSDDQVHMTENGQTLTLK